MEALKNVCRATVFCAVLWTDCLASLFEMCHRLCLPNKPLPRWFRPHIRDENQKSLANQVDFEDLLSDVSLEELVNGSVNRIVIVGITGSGKSTLSEWLCSPLIISHPRITHIEVDRLHFDPEWTTVKNKEFKRRLLRAMQKSGERWVMDGNYLSYSTKAHSWGAADLAVWIDLPLPVLFFSLVLRCLFRILFAQPVCNGNIETWERTLFGSVNESVLRYALKVAPSFDEKIVERIEDPKTNSDIRWVRVRNLWTINLWLLRLGIHSSIERLIYWFYGYKPDHTAPLVALKQFK